MTDQTEIGRGQRTLRRVVPIAVTDVRGGIALTLFSVEDYADGFDVRGRLVVPDAHLARALDNAHSSATQARLLARAKEVREGNTSNVMPMASRPDSAMPPDTLRTLLPRMGVEVRDDRGSLYRLLAHGGGSYGEGVFGLEFLFRPALDLAATELHIEMSEISWKSVPPMKGDAPAQVDTGPWVVVVDLSTGRDVVVTGEPL